MSEQPIDATRWTRYIWLVYLGALFFQPIFDPRSAPGSWIVVAVLIALFLPIYFATFRSPSPDRQLWLTAGMAALGLVGSLFNAAAGVFIIYAAATAGHFEPVRRAVAVIVGLFAVLGLAFLISPIPIEWRVSGMAPAFVFTLVIGAVNIFEAERERGQRRLLLADEEIERLATLAERERIGRDLHDLLGHTLSVVVVKSELAGRLVERDPERALAEIRDVERIGREALSEVRSAVRGFRSRDLAEELDGARRAFDAAEIEVEIASTDPSLPGAQASALALALREAVTNVVRHAGARRATISIRSDASNVVLEVTDDGRGIDAAEGAGLAGMRERVASLGGSVEVTGGHGTRVLVRLPVPEAVA